MKRRKYPRKVVITKDMDVGYRARVNRTPNMLNKESKESPTFVNNIQRPATPEIHGVPLNSLRSTPSHSVRSSIAIDNNDGNSTYQNLSSKNLAK